MLLLVACGGGPFGYEPTGQAVLVDAPADAASTVVQPGEQVRQGVGREAGGGADGQAGESAAADAGEHEGDAERDGTDQDHESEASTVVDAGDGSRDAFVAPADAADFVDVAEAAVVCCYYSPPGFLNEWVCPCHD
jgi:hypothetical protein